MNRFLLFLTVLVFAPIGLAFADDSPKKIDISTAKSLHDDGVVFVDARKASSFKKGHISGAYNMSISGGELSEENLLKRVAKDQPVVFYCDCPNQYCNVSPLAAKEAADMGFQNIYFLKAAISGWSEAGYDIIKE